jgi:hypothetical protein
MLKFATTTDFSLAEFHRDRAFAREKARQMRVQHNGQTSSVISITEKTATPTGRGERYE